MKWIYCFLIVLQVSLFSQEQFYYIIDIKGIESGSIQMEKNNAQTKVITSLKTQKGIKNFDYIVIENNTKTSVGNFYTIERTWNRRILGKHMYQITPNSIIFSFVKEGKSQLQKTFSIPLNSTILSDYFSYIPLLQKSKKHPNTFSIVDVKNIVDSIDTLIPIPLNIYQAGKEKIKLDSKEFLSEKFVLQGDGKNLQFWLDENDNILQIKDSTSQMTIRWTENIESFLSNMQDSIFTKKRPCPFEFNKEYKYIFQLDGKSIGDIVFILHQEDKKYICSTNLELWQQKTKITSMARIVFDENWEMMYYGLEENYPRKKVEIQCEVTPKALKKRFIQNQNILEYIVAFPINTIFLDNNPIVLLALFMMKFPFDYKDPISCSIYHPRRLQCSDATIKILQNNEQYHMIEIKTPYHTMWLWVHSVTGQLHQYAQGKLKIFLQK